MNYRWVPGVKYIAGQTFQSEYGVHEAGSVVEEAPGFQNLEVLVANRFLWPYAPDDGYAWLPPHLFSAVKTREEVKAVLVGDPKGSQRVPNWPDEDNPEEDGTPPAEFSQAEFEGEQQLAIREDIKQTAQPGQKVPRDPGPSPEDVAKEATADRDKQDRARESRLKTPTPRKRKES
jgi:hypothetical protein